MEGLLIETIFQPILNRTEEFLLVDMGIDILSCKKMSSNLRKVILKQNTTIIGIGGNVKFMIAVSYDDKLLSRLTTIFLEGEEFLNSEKDELFESVSMEIANTVIGNALKNPFDNSLLTLTPPIYVHEARSLSRNIHNKILDAMIHTEYGDLAIYAIYPDTLEDFQ